MAKNHLKRINTPRTWKIKRKGIKFVTRPNPGQSSFTLGVSINHILKDLLELAKTTKEAKEILNSQEVLVDNRRIKDIKFITGFMDVISIPAIDKQYRVMISGKGKIDVIEITKEEAKSKTCKVKGKRLVAGKVQLNLIDGKNVFADKEDVKVGDSVVYDLIKKKIAGIVKLDKNSKIFLIGGKHIGSIGTIINIEGRTITYKNEEGDTIETLKRYAYCIGNDMAKVKNE